MELFVCTIRCDIATSLLERGSSYSRLVVASELDCQVASLRRVNA